MANCYHLTFNLRDNGVRLPPKLLLVTKVTDFKRFLKDKVLKKKRKHLKTIFVRCLQLFTVVTVVSMT